MSPASTGLASDADKSSHYYAERQHDSHSPSMLLLVNMHTSKASKTQQAQATVHAGYGCMQCCMSIAGYSLLSHCKSDALLLILCTLLLGSACRCELSQCILLGIG